MPKISKLSSFVAANKASNINDLTTDAQVLFGFLTLLVDIQYRNRYGQSFDSQYGKGYSKDYHKQLYSKSSTYKRKIL